LTKLVKRIAFVLAVPVAALALVGCGGDDDDSGSADDDPSVAAIEGAGLEICSETNDQFSQSTVNDPGVVQVRAFFVAEDCGGQDESENTLTFILFEDRETRDAGVAKIEAASSDAAIDETGAVVVVARGPDKETNLAGVKEAYAAEG
jgi:hypothetical protein